MSDEAAVQAVYSFDWSITAAFSSSFIALTALVFAFYMGAVQRKHNRLSVKPHLGFNKTVTTITTPQLEIELINSGTGPAVIKNYSIFLDNNLIVLPSNEIWNHITKELGITPASNRHGGMIYHKEEAVLAGGKSVIFFIDKVNEIEADTLKNAGILNGLIEDFLDRINIKIEYESIYGEKDIVELQNKI